MERLFKHLKHALHVLNSNEYMQSRGLELEERSRVAHSSCLESLYLQSLYDELSAAVDRGVGELRLMTLGNQGSS